MSFNDTYKKIMNKYRYILFILGVIIFILLGLDFLNISFNLNVSFWSTIFGFISVAIITLIISEKQQEFIGKKKYIETYVVGIVNIYNFFVRLDKIQQLETDEDKKNLIRYLNLIYYQYKDTELDRNKKCDDLIADIVKSYENDSDLFLQEIDKIIDSFKKEYVDEIANSTYESGLLWEDYQKM